MQAARRARRSDAGDGIVFSARPRRGCLSRSARSPAASLLVATLAAYLVLQLAYSLALKHVPYLGAFAIAIGFVLRIVAGGIGARVPLTPWIVALGFLLALLLALGKRHGDLVNARAVGAGLRYDRTTLERILVAIAAATFTAYVLYTLSPTVLARHGHHPLVFSTPWVALGLGRYLQARAPRRRRQRSERARGQRSGAAVLGRRLAADARADAVPLSAQSSSSSLGEPSPPVGSSVRALSSFARSAARVGEERRLRAAARRGAAPAARAG